MHRKVYEEAGRTCPQAMAVVKITHIIGKLDAIDAIPEEKVQATIEKLDDGTDMGRRCAFALRLYTDAKRAGVSTRGFWTRPAEEIQKEIFDRHKEGV